MRQDPGKLFHFRLKPAEFATRVFQCKSTNVSGREVYNLSHT